MVIYSIYENHQNTDKYHVMLKRIFSLSNGALLVALSLSTIAAWYSIIGLTAIFAGAVVPIIIMGTALEFAKITTTVWLRKYWYRCSFIMKVYLVPAVVLLALLTSMGIFGFLSKAHLDQNIGSGDVQAQVSLLDEKIATQRETIKSSKSMLAQMDQQVNDIMTKGDSEKSVERSVTIRKQQAKERASLQKDIEVANKEIAKLNEERAPIASELRKVEAEVGPIKYIAALIYGDNADANMLEAAVRWVIILLVVVFDPLAIMLVLAANQSKEWDENNDVEEENKLREQVEHDKVVETILEDTPDPYVADVGEKPTIEELEVTIEEEEAFKDLEPKPEPEKTVAELHPYLNKPFSHFENTTPIVHKPEVEEPAYEQDDGPLTEEQIEQVVESVEDTKILTMGIDEVERPGDYVTDPGFEGVKVNGEWVQTGPSFPVESGINTEGMTSEVYKQLEGEYVEFEGKRMHERVLKSIRPDLFAILPDDQISTSFGTTFPSQAMFGNMYVRTDIIPNRVFKFNGRKWIEVNKETTDSYLDDPKYIQFLVDKLSTGEYDPDTLTQSEQDVIKGYLEAKK